MSDSAIFRASFGGGCSAISCIPARAEKNRFSHLAELKAFQIISKSFYGKHFTIN
jgi:hypothetical protein